MWQQLYLSDLFRLCMLMGGPGSFFRPENTANPLQRNLQEALRMLFLCAPHAAML